MKTLFNAFISIAIITLSASTTLAAEKGQWRAGLLGGQTRLMGDIGKTASGNSDENALGWGVTAGSYVLSNMTVDASFLMSSHENVTHNDYSFGVDYFFEDYVAVYPNIAAGITFLNNRIKDVDLSGDAFGLYLGGGVDFELTPAITTGIQLRYTFALDDGKTTSNGVEYKTADDTFMVLLRVLYTFGGTVD